MDVDLLVGAIQIAEKASRLNVALSGTERFRESGWKPKHYGSIASLTNMLFGNVDKPHAYF